MKGRGASTIIPHVRCALLGFLDLADAVSLRLVCHELRSAVAEFPWDDCSLRIVGGIASWRASFPHVRHADGADRMLTEDDWGHNMLSTLIVANSGDVMNERLRSLAPTLRYLDARCCAGIPLACVRTPELLESGALK